MSIQEYRRSYCHYANAAKLTQVVSFAAGVAGAAISTRELIDFEVGTPVQVMTLALPVIATVGKSLRIGYYKYWKKEINSINPLPTSMMTGMALGMACTAIAAMVTLSDCDQYRNCDWGNFTPVVECKTLIGSCQDLLLPQSSWFIGPWDSAEEQQNSSLYYCYPTKDFQGISLIAGTKSEAIARICKRVLLPGVMHPNTGDYCIGAWNYHWSLDANITEMQNRLFDDTQCDISQFNDRIQTDLLVTAIITPLLFCCFLCNHPLVCRDESRPVRIVPLQMEEDPILAAVPARIPKFSLGSFLENI